MQQASSDPRLKGLLAIAPRATEAGRLVGRRWMWAAGASIVVHATTVFALVLASHRETSRPLRAMFAGQARHVQLEVRASMASAASIPVRLNARPQEIIVRPEEVQIADQRYRLTESHPAAPMERSEPDELAQSSKHPEVAMFARQAMAEPELEVAEATLELERREPLPMPVPASVASEPALTRDENLSQGTDARIRPRFISNRPPRYPEQARQRGWQGTVYLRLTLDEQGQVVRVEVDRSSGYPVLDAEAANAVRQWRAEPAQVNGRPVSSEELLPVRFELPR